MAELRRSSIRGGSVTLASQAVNIAIQLVSTVVLARLLSPEDYGVMAMALAVTGFAGLFRDLGLSAAAIQKKDLTAAQQSNLLWLNLAMGAALTAVVAAASPLVALFYGRPELGNVMLVLSSSFLIGSFGAQHGARLVREMRFARQAIATISGALIGLAIAIALALRGFSYWSLVWGSLGNTIATAIILLAASPFRPTLPSRNSGIREMLRFGANVAAFDFVNYFHRNLDNILIGKFSGTVALGSYSRAYSLLMLPINALRQPVISVAFPSMSRLHDKPSEFRAYYRNVTGLLALLSMPFTAFLFSVSEPFVDVVLGPQWKDVSTIFAVLALVGFIQPVVTMWALVVLSLGLGERYLKIGAINTAVACIGFLGGIRWGAEGVAIGYAISTAVSSYPILGMAFKGTPILISDFHASVICPFFSSMVAALVCISLAKLAAMPANMNNVTYIALMSFAFLTSYLLSMMCSKHGRSDLNKYMGGLVHALK